MKQCRALIEALVLLVNIFDWNIFDWKPILKILVRVPEMMLKSSKGNIKPYYLSKRDLGWGNPVEVQNLERIPRRISNLCGHEPNPKLIVSTGPLAQHSTQLGRFYREKIHVINT